MIIAVYHSINYDMIYIYILYIYIYTYTFTYIYIYIYIHILYISRCHETPPALRMKQQNTKTPRTSYAPLLRQVLKFHHKEHTARLLPRALSRNEYHLGGWCSWDRRRGRKASPMFLAKRNRRVHLQQRLVQVSSVQNPSLIPLHWNGRDSSIGLL